MLFNNHEIKNLTNEIKNLQDLKEEIQKLNNNIDVFERLACAIEHSNELKEQELANAYTKKPQR